MSAGGVIGLGVNILGVGLMTGVFMYIIDNVNNLSRTFLINYATLQTMAYLLLIADAYAFLYLIASVLHYLVQSSNEAGGVV